MDPRIWLLTAAQFASATGAYAYTGLLAPLADDLGVGLATAGQLAAAYALTFALLGPIAAALTARVERRALLAIGLGFAAAFNLLSAFVPDFTTALMLRVAAGIAATLVLPGVAATMLVPPEQRGRAIATVLSGLTFAFALGIPLGTAIGRLGGVAGHLPLLRGPRGRGRHRHPGLPAAPALDRPGRRALARHRAAARHPLGARDELPGLRRPLLHRRLYRPDRHRDDGDGGGGHRRDPGLHRPRQPGRHPARREAVGAAWRGGAGAAGAAAGDGAARLCRAALAAAGALACRAARALRLQRRGRALRHGADQPGAAGGPGAAGPVRGAGSRGRGDLRRPGRGCCDGRRGDRRLRPGRDRRGGLGGRGARRRLASRAYAERAPVTSA
jgi:hypothetical protein